MACSINEIRDATVTRLGQLTLPISITTSAKSMKQIKTEDLIDGGTIVTVTPGAHQFLVERRNGGTHKPIITIGVHGRVTANTDGEPTQSEIDNLVWLCEEIGKQITGAFPSYSTARAESAEIPVLYSEAMLQEHGIFQAAILVTFNLEYDHQ